MTALVARMRPLWADVAGKSAEITGAAVGKLGRSVPGVAGPLAISYGFHEVYAPLGWIIAGGFLLLLDKRVP